MMGSLRLETSTAIQIAAIILVSSYPEASFQQERRIDPEIQQKIDNYIQNVYLPASEVSGLGLAIVQNDEEVLYTTGYGMADIERGILNGNDTQFLIASISKSFTAVVASKLLNERFPEMGEKVLDTPITQLLPNLNFTLIDRFRAEHITMRDLLAHRVCVENTNLHQFSEALGSREEILYRSRYMEEECGIKTDFIYNNHIYVVAGEVIAALANKTYEEAIQDLLDDLGMENSAFSSRSDDYKTGLPNRARPYYTLNNETFPMNTDLIKRITLHNAAGGLFSTPNDIVKYLRFQLNQGELDGRQIIPKNVMEWVFKPSILIPVSTSSLKQDDNDDVLIEFAYSLGWWLGSYNGWEYNYHSGYWAAYESLASFFPAKKLAIFTSSNVAELKVNPAVLHTFIFEALRGNKNAEVEASKVKAQLDKENKQKAKKENANLELLLKHQQKKTTSGESKVKKGIDGSYGKGATGNVEIFEQFNNQTNKMELFLEHGRWHKGWLEKTDQDWLYYVNFTTDLIHDTYAAGGKEGGDFITFDDEDTIMLFRVVPAFTNIWGTFERGVGLDTLPVIPWEPDSCGRGNLAAK